jgi:broad specificity phosphatase PhoE
MLYLIRHGHTARNALDEVHGRIDDDLDEEGQLQADALGALFAAVTLDAVYASPLRRSVQTAAPIARASGLDVGIDDGLLDRDYGPWTGHRKAEVITEFGSLDAAPGVEPWARFSERVVAGFDAVAATHHGQVDGVVAIVAHDAVNQAVLQALFPDRFPDHHAIRQRNGCWNRLQPAPPSGWTLAVLDAVPGDGQLP